MPISWQQSVIGFIGATSFNVTGTFSPAVAPGQTVVLLFGWGDSGADTFTVTDNASGGSNVYTLGTVQPVGGENWGIGYCSNVLGSPTTITFATPLSHTLALMVDVYAGVGAFVSSSSGTTSGAGLATPTAIVPPVNGCLIYGTAVATSGGSALAHTGNGFTQRINFSSAWGSEELIQGTAASISATFDLGSTGIAFEMVFSPAGVPASSQSQGSAGGSIFRIVRMIGN